MHDKKEQMKVQCKDQGKHRGKNFLLGKLAKQSLKWLHWNWLLEQMCEFLCEGKREGTQSRWNSLASVSAILKTKTMTCSGSGFSDLERFQNFMGSILFVRRNISLDSIAVHDSSWFILQKSTVLISQTNFWVLVGWELEETRVEMDGRVWHHKPNSSETFTR